VFVRDGTLVLGVLEGDRSAFAELYDRRARLIRAICYDATRDIETAAELTQEVFLRAYAKLGRLNDPDSFASWLAGIARRVCREWRRGRLRRLRVVTDSPIGPDSEAAASPQPDPPDERIGELREAIATLPERERLALHAFYLQGMDAEQAGTVLGLSRSGLYRVLSVARDRLRRLWTRNQVRS
jgi:RNA polymerase sigma-70 factor (ECF subfamily)